MAKRTIYRISDDTGQTVAWEASKGKAQKSFDWWSKDGGIEPDMKAIEYENTREGVVGLLRAYGDTI